MSGGKKNFAGASGWYSHTVRCIATGVNDHWVLGTLSIMLIAFLAGPILPMMYLCAQSVDQLILVIIGEIDFPMISAPVDIHYTNQISFMIYSLCQLASYSDSQVQHQHQDLIWLRRRLQS